MIEREITREAPITKGLLELSSQHGVHLELQRRAHFELTLKIQTPETIPLIEKIRAELKKRAEAKAKRMLHRGPKSWPNAASSRSAHRYRRPL